MCPSSFLCRGGGGTEGYRERRGQQRASHQETQGTLQVCPRPAESQLSLWLSLWSLRPNEVLIRKRRNIKEPREKGRVLSQGKLERGLPASTPGKVKAGHSNNQQRANNFISESQAYEVQYQLTLSFGHSAAFSKGAGNLSSEIVFFFVSL